MKLTLVYRDIPSPLRKPLSAFKAKLRVKDTTTMVAVTGGDCAHVQEVSEKLVAYTSIGEQLAKMNLSYAADDAIDTLRTLIAYAKGVAA